MKMKGSSEEEKKNSGYDRLVLKNEAPHHYLTVTLVLEDDTTRLNGAELKQFIINSLKALHGEVGAALTFDLLTFDEERLTALLRVVSRDLVKLWSSLTLQGRYQDGGAAFRVQQVSPFLSALTGNSRDLQLE